MIACLASGISAGEAAPPEEGRNASTQQLALALDEGIESSVVPLRWANGWILVPVKIRGMDAGWFKIATGWSDSAIDPDVARRLGLPTISPTGFIPQDTRERVLHNMQFVRADGLRCCAASVPCATLRVEDLSTLSKISMEMYGHPITGVLGWDLLSTIPFHLDLGNLHLVWQAQADPPADAVSSRILNRGGFPFVETTLGEDVPALMMVNTSGTHAMFDADFVMANGDRFWNGRKTADSSTSFFVEADDDRLPLPQVARLGPQGRWVRTTFLGRESEMPAVIHPERNRTYGGMSIGMTLLRHYKIWFDGPRSLLWATPATLSPAQAVARRTDPKPSAVVLEYAMFNAIVNNDGEGVRELLAAGGNRDRMFGNQYPLSIAAMASARAAGTVLLEAGANPTMPASLGGKSPPVNAAAGSDNSEFLETLLKRRADPRQLSSSGMVPLEIAARYGGPKTLALLLDAAGLPADRERCISMVFEACGGGNLEFARKVLQHADFEDLQPQSQKGSVAYGLEAAAAMGHPPIVEWIFAEFKGTDPNVGNEVPPLLSAIVPTRPEKNDEIRLELVKSLLKNGASPDISFKGVTPLLLASRHGSAEIVDVLLRAGVSTKAKDYKQRNAVHRAAGANQPAALLSLLIKAGVEFDEVDSNADASPLSIYSGHGNLAACKILLDAGANPNQETLTGGSALQHALRNTSGSDEEVDAIVALLLAHGATATDGISLEFRLLFFAIDGGRPGYLTRLAKSGTDFEKPMEDLNGVTPLMLASAGSDPATVSRLLELGGKWETVDHKGHNAVAHAAAAGRTGNLAVLIASGAKPDAVTQAAIPPLCVAALSSQLASIPVLLDAGVDLTAKHPVTQLTAREIASSRNDQAMIKLIDSWTASPDPVPDNR